MKYKKKYKMAAFRAELEACLPKLPKNYAVLLLHLYNIPPTDAYPVKSGRKMDWHVLNCMKKICVD